jgi:hypothetical protein
MVEPSTSTIDVLSILESQLAELRELYQSGRAAEAQALAAALVAPSVLRDLLGEAERATVRLQEAASSDLEPEVRARLRRLAKVAALIGGVACMVGAPTGHPFSCIAPDVDVVLSGATWAPTTARADRDRVVAVLNQATGELIDLPTRPGPFTMGGPGTDVVIRSAIGVAAIGEIQPNGSLRVTSVDEKRAEVGRNDLCPCGSGRKFKRCCLN